MSETLGNAIDPLDTIKDYETDALRFTLSLGTAGQDLNLSTEMLTSSKALCSRICLVKLIYQLGKLYRTSRLDPLEDVIRQGPSTVNRTGAKNYLLWEYIFVTIGVPTPSILHFWRYIEASKARLYNSEGDSVALTSQPVLLCVFENILKLLHPFMPFVTEELWQEERQVLALLSRLDFHNVSFTESPPGDANQSIHLVASEGLEAYLPLAAMVDISAEVQRLSKRLAKMQTEYDGLLACLSYPSLVEKAPEDAVRGVQEAEEN